MKIIREEDRARLCLQGELTIQNVAALREGLLQVLGQNEAVEIDLTGITAVDLAGLQLLCSAHRLAMAAGKNLALTAESVPVLREARRASGFVLQQSCRHAPEADCYWVGGMEQ